ncbi:hypothetical protein BBJ28_00001893 [Nothophytophthora sp. Chile5]|nr:hypothetical protein BBJ28_00001893 [Nothophytophthora sp. Chile5]
MAERLVRRASAARLPLVESISVLAGSRTSPLPLQPTDQEAELMASEMLQSYYDWANATEQTMLDWVDPEGGWKAHPMADYPLANFASVYTICIGYLLFVALGTTVMKMGVPAINTSPLQFIYNPVQIIACSYMCVEAALQAYRHDYSPLPCNAFKADNPVRAYVLSPRTAKSESAMKKTL